MSKPIPDKAEVALEYPDQLYIGTFERTSEVRAEIRADKVRAAIRNRDTGPVFDWLMAALSYQGISDQVAYAYMEKHGRARWAADQAGP